MDIRAAADKIVETVYGNHKVTAHKRGRDPRWPYVPVVLAPLPYVTPEYLAASSGRLARYDYTQRQLMGGDGNGRAFATRAEAIDFANRHIAAARIVLRSQLLDPLQGRPVRAHYGLPRKIA